jgi:hypothetical protein
VATPKTSELHRVAEQLRIHYKDGLTIRQITVKDASLTFIADALSAAGLVIYGSIRIPNEYGSLRYNGPWFAFDTNQGLFKVGWRKRVINMWWWTDWQAYAAGSPGKSFEHFYDYAKLTTDVQEALKGGQNETT